MFNIGDRVKGLRTGIKTDGRVLDIMPAHEYLASTPTPYNQHPPWDKLYPDWKEKNVVIVRYNKPKRTYSMSMIMESMKKTGGQVIMVPYTLFAVYPEDDLKLLP